MSVSFLPRLSVLFFIILLSACLGAESPPGEAPANVVLTEGDTVVVVEWDVIPGRLYWLFYKQGTGNVNLDSYDQILMGVKPPFVLSQLTNATQYAFSVTSSQDGSPVGPFSASLLATPRLLGPSIPWFIGSSLGVNDLHSIAFGNNTYVTVGDSATVFSGSYSYTSDTGVSAWNPPTTLPISAASNLTAVRYDGRRFMALADDGSTIKSSDATAQTWELATPIVGAPAMNALAVGAGRYVAVGDAGAIYSNSTDAATAAWVEQTSGTANDLYGVAYVFDRFIAVGASGTLLTSSDGVSWTTQISNTGDSLRGVAYGAENYVAVGDAGAIVSSADAVNWTLQTNPTTESFRAICFGPDEQFIAVGSVGTLAYSTTGADGSWLTANAGSIDLNSIAPNLLFNAIGAAGTNVTGK